MGEVMELYAHLIDSPQVGVAAFLVGWHGGLVVGYVLVRLVLR